MIGAELSMGILPVAIVVGIVWAAWVSRDHFVNGAIHLQDMWYGGHGKRAIQRAKDRHPGSPNNVFVLPHKAAQFYDQDEDVS
jgi:hypothetical protein